MADLLVVEGMRVEAIIDARAYRTLAQQAMHRLHDREREIERQRQTIGRLRDEVCRMRAQIIHGTAEAA